MEISAFLVSLICFSRSKDRYLKWTMPYLFLLLLWNYQHVILEEIFTNQSTGSIIFPCRWNIFSLVFLYCIYYKNPFYKVISKLFMICFVLFALIYSIMDLSHEFHSGVSENWNIYNDCFQLFLSGRAVTI